jgi:hypothetical protein
MVCHNRRFEFCCSLALRVDHYTENSHVTFDKNVDTNFITKGSGGLECEPTVPDLVTETQPYCPPGGLSAKHVYWTRITPSKCCSKWESCSLGYVKTSPYQDCPGDTFYDTQSFGCKTECLSGNYLDSVTETPASRPRPACRETENPKVVGVDIQDLEYPEHDCRGASQTRHEVLFYPKSLP